MLTVWHYLKQHLYCFSAPSELLSPWRPLLPYGSYKASMPDGLSRHLQFLTSGHSDAQPSVSECPDVKNYKWWLNPVWHMMLYSCTHMTTVDVKWLTASASLWVPLHYYCRVNMTIFSRCVVFISSAVCKMPSVFVCSGRRQRLWSWTHNQRWFLPADKRRLSTNWSVHS